MKSEWIPHVGNDRVLKREDDVFTEYKNHCEAPSPYWLHCICVSQKSFNDIRYAVELRDEPGVYYISEGPSTVIDKNICKKYHEIEQAKIHLMLI